MITDCSNTIFKSISKIYELYFFDYDTLSANVVNLFPKRYQNSDDQQDEKNIFSKIP